MIIQRGQGERESERERERERQTDRQTDRQTETQTDGQKYYCIKSVCIPIPNHKSKRLD